MEMMDLIGLIGFADDYLPGVDMVVADLSFIEAYKKDFDHHFAQILQKPSLESIFFGGGTPSLMEPFVVEGIVAC